MSNEIRRAKLFGRRALVLGGLKGGLLLTLVGRLYYLQILKAKEYTTLSDSNRIKLFLLPPLRGNILDRGGRLLAGTRNYYRIILNPERVENTRKTVEHLANVLRLNRKEKEALIKKVSSHRSRQPLMLREHLNWKDVARVEVNTPTLPGVSIEVGQARYYPLGTYAAHVLGHLGPVTKEEVEKNPLLNHPDFKIGKNGVESVFESTLRGKAGVQRMEVNAFGLSVRELSREPSIAGNDLKLTLDARVQEFAGKVFEEKNRSGSVVVMDITNGDLLTMLSAPGFDPAQFTYGVSHDYWQQLINNPDVPLINKSIATQYPPGSTFKIVVALAALKENVNPGASVYCPGYVTLGNRQFHCWKKGGHGHVNMQQAIMGSCNAYFFTVARRIGPDAISAMAHRMGLGSALNFGLPGEKDGLIPTRDWKRKRHKEPWQTGDTLNFGIGQGFTLTTPLQLAVMVSRLASGKAVAPRLVVPRSKEKGLVTPNFQSLDIPQNHLELVRYGMYSVSNIPGGTAYGSRIPDKDMTIAGKTGTAQVVSRKHLQNNDSMTEEEKLRAQHHALFVGFAPYHAPRYAISVIVEHGQAGSAAAAPVGRDVMYHLQQLVAADTKKEGV